MEVQLPDEIWMLIASFLPKKTLMTLCSISRAFFNVAMDERYGSTELTVKTIAAFK